MPELPEVETVRRTLKNFIVGKKIQEIRVHYDKIITGDTNNFVASLTGQTIRDIDRVGKYLIFILDSQAFISHLRMEGKYNIVAASKSLNKHEHLTFAFSDGTELRYQDTRKFGRLELVNKETYRQDLPLCKLGPEPWDADSKEIYSKIHKSSLPIKTLLLDQSIMTGIGNIYANEICFRMKMHPATPGKRVSKKRVAELITVSKEILEQAIAQGGTTIHSFDANGITGLFQVQLQVHMQKVCPVCHGAITKEMVRGRGTYYCKECQKKKG
ncbi:DNA-formamidopyrimidine glycosylase [Acetobacterium tundrae]|uniref:Formamidopyrimidine-DNA glycosylase n=1 Tax=Acetobacterium tundrae TaxID=132932 RepID=A0ABR6WHT2_9FIRM|nr:DNA-formamidopyrimidine glycosylase [Acetobacterium tundrae]MBC3796020.1 DNA-formamidopyrimidine glycosylase [Acetobacterium tundrae]